MSKITDYTAATRFDSGDVLLKDGTNGTKTISVANAAREFAGLTNAKNHRNILQNRNLGTSVTPSQLAAIKAGTFDDLYVGDYWEINGHSYTIADIDYWYNKFDKLRSASSADTQAVNVHHLVMIPTTPIGNQKMNDTNTTDGAYLGSKMYTEYLDAARTQIETDFGSMLITHREIFSDNVYNGIAGSHVWCDSKVDLMNEVMVYGHYAFSPIPNGGYVNHDRYTLDKEQLALFQLDPARIGRDWFWLRDVVSSTDFAYTNVYGDAASAAASATVGVRPAFAIGDPT